MIILCIYLIIWAFWLIASCYVVSCNQSGYNDFPFYLIQNKEKKDFIISREDQKLKLSMLENNSQSNHLFVVS